MSDEIVIGEVERNNAGSWRASVRRSRARRTMCCFRPGGAWIVIPRDCDCSAFRDEHGLVLFGAPPADEIEAVSLPRTKT